MYKWYVMLPADMLPKKKKKKVEIPVLNLGG